MSADRSSDSNSAPSADAIWRDCLWIWAALMLLVLLTLGLAHVPLGRYNLPVALSITAVQALLIAVLFMELRVAKNFIRLAAVAAFVFIAVMFALSFSDLISRSS